MTIQDLKNNRTEIIAKINEVADSSKMAEIMTAMVRLVEGAMAEATDPMDLVDEVVELMGYEKKETISLTVDGEVFDNLSDYNRANNQRLMRKR